MIYTSSYDKCNNTSLKKVSISGDKGKSIGYIGTSYSKLAPKKEFWEKWHSNIGIIPKEENDLFYVEQFYKQVLVNIDPDEIIKELDESVLLCYESSGFCHRHIVSDWLNIFCGIEVPEIKVENGIIIPDDKPLYIRNLLAHVINNNTHGFTSIKALKYYLKGDIIDKQIKELKDEEEIEKLKGIEWNYWSIASRIESTTDENEIKKLIKK